MLEPTFSRTVPGARSALVATLFCLGVACGTEPVDYAETGSGANACAVDEDQDGYGVGCAKGPDCNDGDPAVSAGCGFCDQPNEGCDCAPGSAPVECLTQSLIDRDTLLCKAGTRFCQDGVWSECTGVVSFEADVKGNSELGMSSQALLAPDAGTAPCSPCRPSCFPVEDSLDVVDGGLDTDNSRDVDWAAGGGITLSSGDPMLDVPTVDDSRDCSLANPADADCDGVPDGVDERTGRDATFGTTQKTLTLTLAPGETRTGRVILPTLVRAVDLYFLLDATENQGGIAVGLANAMTAGNFFDDPDAVTCADTDLDGAPNDELKMQGIAGNVSCLTRDGRVGAGWSREIPFEGPDASNIRYGHFDEYLFENVRDVGTPPADLRTALLGVTMNANFGGPNGPIQSLFAVATGNEAYVGWDRSAVPARSCAAGHFGYGCFRNDALPVVALFTGEPIYNGPTPAAGNLGMGYPTTYPASITSGQVHAGTYPHYLPVPITNENDASAYNLGTGNLAGTPAGSLHDDLLTFTGTTEGMASHYDRTQMNCPALGDDTGADAAFTFQVTQAKILTVSTAGTRFPSVLSIRKVPTVAQSNVSVALGNTLPQGDTIDNPALLPNIDSGQVVTVTGTSLNANAVYPREYLGCYDQASSSSTDYGPDMVFRLQASANMRVRFAADGSNYGKSMALFDRLPRLGGYGVNGTDVVTTSSDFTMPQNMSFNSARLISGYSGAGDLRRGLPISNAAMPAVNTGTAFTNAGCAVGTASARTMLVRFQLGTAARMRIETSGDADGLAPNFDHVLGVYTGHGAVPASMLACAEDNLTSATGEPLSRGVIERDFPAGLYTVVVRGRSMTDTGGFRLTMRDVVDGAPVAMGCHVDEEGAPNSFEADLVTGTVYYLVMRGQQSNDAVNGEGAYTFTMTDTNVGGSYDVCRGGVNGEFTGAFSPGTYYAVVKGQAANARGWYQLTVGDPTRETATNFNDLRSWGTTQGVLAGAGVRVLGVHTGIQPALIEQLRGIASATGAVDASAQPLVQEVNPGSAMLANDVGHAIVRSVQGLSAGTLMDVSMRLVITPDLPTPAFETHISAIDTVGDGCDAPINDVHQSCASGARPQFDVTFTNPAAPGNVPPNPADPNGGYWLTLEMVGDGRYVLERIPVYVIPTTMPVAPPAGFPASGTYWQDFRAQNCVAGERPAWSSLAFTSTLPGDTQVRWALCSAEDAAGLGSCSPETLATVTSGGTCTANTDCPNGYCQAGTCQFAAGPSCLSDEVCGTNGVCVGGTCRWTDQPIDPGALLASRVDDPWLRVEVTLSSSTDRTLAPTVHTWRIEYDCIPSE